MRRIRTGVAVALAIAVGGCAPDLPVSKGELVELAADAASTSSSMPRPPVDSAPATTIPSKPIDRPSLDLTAIFDLLGERTSALEAVGYDEENDRYVIYTKSGAGSPAIHDVDELPALVSPGDLVDDGGGRTSGEGHAISRHLLDSFDIYWTSSGVTEVRSLRTGVDALKGRGAHRLHSTASSRVIFEDAGRSFEADPRVLRSNSVGADGQFAENWVVQFDAGIPFALDAGSAGALVATVAPGDALEGPIHRLHLVEDDGFVRSIDAPSGLLWIQPSRESGDGHATCGDSQIGLTPIGLNGVDRWDIDTTNQLLTACREGVPISTTLWCCGMGEYFGSIDSNNDGVEEVFVGGTSVGGGGGGLYSLIDGELAPIRTDIGGELQLFTGDFGGRFGEYGCRDGLFVQVEVRGDGDDAWATRTFYRIEGHSATVVDVERIDWRPETFIKEPSIWHVYETAPDEIVNDLFPCAPPDSFALSNTDGLRIHVQSRPLTTVSSCENWWPRPYSPLMLTRPDGTEQLWESPDDYEIQLYRIDPGDFIATSDGRFALLDYFACSHESTMKTIYTGRYDPSTGQLLAWRRVEVPEEFVYDGPYYRRHPDRLIIDEEGNIVGELDTDDGTLELILG